MRHRDQRPAQQRLVDDRHRQPGAVPADPPAALPGQGQLTFYLCWAPQDRPATMTYFITIAGRRWPVEETSKRQRTRSAGTSPRSAPGTGCAGTPPWPPSPSSAPPPSATPWAALRLPARTAAPAAGRGRRRRRRCRDADLLIPLGDAPVPARGGQPCPPGLGPDRAVRRRDRLAGPPRRAVRRGADQPRPARLRAPLVCPPAAPPGHRPLAPPQRPAGWPSPHKPRRPEGGNTM